MKKPLIYASVLLAAASAITGIAMASANSIAESSAPALIAVTDSETVTQKPVANTKNETVYVITNAEGTVKSEFIGSAIYQGDEELPFNAKITYYLDGEAIDAKDLAGKSGHVKIVYEFESVASYAGKQVPFLAVTGATLDSARFDNVEITSGKIVSKDTTALVIGYALPGLNTDLGTDFLPDSFAIEADTTDFKLGTTYTILMNDIFADFDTSKLSDVDTLASSINQLASGLDQIIDGESDLEDGLETLITKTGELKTGIDQLADGLAVLASNNDTLQGGATATFNALLLQASQATGQNLTIENYAETLDGIKAQLEQYGQDTTAVMSLKASLDQYNTFCTGLMAYTSKVAEAAAGAATIDEKIPALIDGETALYNGSVKLGDGLDTFKTTGINKLVNFANRDLKTFTRNARETVSAAANYKRFATSSAESVKFIIKTDSI